MKQTILVLLIINSLAVQANQLANQMNDLSNQLNRQARQAMLDDRIDYNYNNPGAFQLQQQANQAKDVEMQLRYQERLQDDRDIYGLGLE